jgi:hypothetical protein
MEDMFGRILQLQPRSILEKQAACIQVPENERHVCAIKIPGQKYSLGINS